MFALNSYQLRTSQDYLNSRCSLTAEISSLSNTRDSIRYFVNHVVAGVRVRLLNHFGTCWTLLSSTFGFPHFKSLISCVQRTFTTVVPRFLTTLAKVLHTEWTLYHSTTCIPFSSNEIVTEYASHPITIECSILKFEEAIILALHQHFFGMLCFNMRRTTYTKGLNARYKDISAIVHQHTYSSKCYAHMLI